MGWIEREHSLVGEMRLLLGDGDAALPGLGLLFDPSDLLAKSRIEGVALEAEEIRSAATLAEVIAGWAGLMLAPPSGMEDRLPELRGLFGEVLSLPLKPLVDSLRGRFLPDGTLADDASPELRRTAGDGAAASRPMRTACGRRCGGIRRAGRHRMS